MPAQLGHEHCAYEPKWVDGQFADMECEHGYSASPPFYTSDALAAERSRREAAERAEARVAELEQLIQDAADFSKEPDFPTWKSRLVPAQPAAEEES